MKENEIRIVYHNGEGEQLPGFISEKESLIGTPEERVRFGQLADQEAVQREKEIEQTRRAIASFAPTSEADRPGIEKNYLNSTRYVVGHEITLADKARELMQTVGEGIAERVEVAFSPQEQEKFREAMDRGAKRAINFLDLYGKQAVDNLPGEVEGLSEIIGIRDKKKAQAAGRFLVTLVDGLRSGTVNVLRNFQRVEREEMRDISGVVIKEGTKGKMSDRVMYEGRQSKELSSQTEGMTRRDFMKLAGLGIGLASVGGLKVLGSSKTTKNKPEMIGGSADAVPPKTVAKTASPVLEKESYEVRKISDTLAVEASREQEEPKLAKPQVAQPTFFEKMTGRLDITSVRQIRSDDNMRYGLSKESYKKMFEAKNYDYRTPGAPLHEGMKNAVRDMTPWMKDLRKIFEEAFREEFGSTHAKDDFFDPSGRVKEPYLLAFLAIVESNWTLNDVNKDVGVVGAWQFLPSTAKAGGLRMTASIDERFDPLLGAKLAAKNLIAMYKKFGSWDLAFCGYNGGHVWRYFSGKKKEEVSHFGFVQYLLDRINMEKDLFQDNKCFVRAKDGTRGLSKRFRMSEADFCKLNNLKPGQALEPGTSLRFKVSDKDRKSVFEEVVSGYKENITYAFKVRAVLAALKDLNPRQFDDKKNYGEIEVYQPPLLIVEHKVAKGETPESIARRYNGNGLGGRIKEMLGTKTVNLGKDLLGFNELSEGSALHVGQVIKVPLREKKIEYTTVAGETMEQISRKLGVSIWHLAQSNRHLDSKKRYKAGERLKITLRPVTLETLSGGNPQKLDISVKKLNVALAAVSGHSGTIPNGQRVRVIKNT